MMPVIIIIITVVSITTAVNIITFTSILLTPYLFCISFLILIFTCFIIALLQFNRVKVSTCLEHLYYTLIMFSFFSFLHILILTVLLSCHIHVSE